MAINHHGDPHSSAMSGPDLPNGMNPSAEKASTIPTDEPHTRENYDTTANTVDTSLLSPEEQVHSERHRRFRRLLLGGVAILMAATGAVTVGAYAKNSAPEHDPARSVATTPASPEATTPTPSASAHPSPEATKSATPEQARKVAAGEKTLDDIVSPGPIVGATYQEVAKKACQAIEYSINKDPENLRNAMDKVQPTDSNPEDLIAYGKHLMQVRGGGNPNDNPAYDLRKVAMAFDCTPLDRLDKPGVDAITDDTPGFTVHITLRTGQYFPYGSQVLLGNKQTTEATMFLSRVKNPMTGGGYDNDGGFRVRYLRHMGGQNLDLPTNLTEQVE